MNHLTDARTRLYDALSHVFDEPVDVGDELLAFSNGRVHLYPPQTVAAPCLWIEQSRGGPRPDVFGTVATFPVAIVVDGADRAQVAALDELIARVYDAAATVGDPIGWEPGPVDVGGPSLRGTVVTVDMRVTSSTLCNPTIKEAVSV